MVSLPALEEVLSLRWPSEDEKPILALCAKDSADSGRPEIHLLTVKNISLEDANQTIKAAGLPTLARISAVHRVSEIPQLGSGKIDLQKLETLL